MVLQELQATHAGTHVAGLILLPFHSSSRNDLFSNQTSNQELQQLQRGVSSTRTDFHPIFVIVVLQELLENLQSYCRFDFCPIHLSIPQIRSYSSYRKVFKVLEPNFMNIHNSGATGATGKPPQLL